MRIIHFFNKNQFVTAGMVMMVAVVLGIVLQQPLFWALPFIWILLPLIFNEIVQYTSYLFWVLLCVLPLSAEWQVTDALSLNFPDEAIMILLTGLFFFKWLLKPEVIPAFLLKHPLFFLIVLHIIWIAITCIYSENPILSIKFLLAKSWFIVPFVLLPALLIQSQKDFKRLALCFILPMLFVVVQAIVRHAFYQFSFEGIKKILSPFFRNHVNYSAMLVCIMAMLAAMLVLTPASQSSRKWLYGMMMVFIAGLILSYSRGAWLALLVGIIMAFVLYKKWLWQLVITGFVLIILITYGLVQQNKYLKLEPDFQHTIFHTNFKDHLEATVAMKDVSNAERIYRWVAGVNMVIDKPVTGFGPNNFYDYYKAYTNSGFKTWVSSNPDHSSVHNYFLLTALEQGLPGLLFFCTLFIAMLGYAQYLFHHLQGRFNAMVALTTGAVVAMVGTLNFLSDLIETDKIGSLFWLSAGILIVLSHRLKIEQQSIAGFK
ncbi:MAG: O-antigen ligase family protein [Sphingobacteriales bacterium]|uniref:O-antigen ligase family protein n=1 Tax=Hydrotalea flava TaxID=714549 RepID=UPI0008310C9A|nr:O-antigen ligase family protein [Hydrotalea flava]RTL52640.1 MAG: O-antigen ligase family protein [Sphingobacteriales bacterium]